jgi:hypothetical protein
LACEFGLVARTLNLLATQPIAFITSVLKLLLYR